MKIGVLETNSAGNGWYLIKAIQNNGYEAVFITTDKNKYHHLELNPALLTENLIVNNSYSSHELLQTCHNSSIQCLIAPGDYQLEICASVNAQLKGFGPSSAAIANCKYKDKTRTLTNSSDSTVEFKNIINIEDAKYWSNYPAIVKPTNGSGSSDVYTINSPLELSKILPRYFKREVNSYGYQFKEGCQIEEYIDGPEYSAECFWNKDHWEILTIIKKETSKNLNINTDHIELLHTCNVSIPNQESNEKIILSWLEKVGLQKTVAHVEFKLDNQIAKLIEINPRLPGGRIVELIKIALDVDVAEIWLKSSLSENISTNLSTLSPKLNAVGHIMPEITGTIGNISYLKSNYSHMRLPKLPMKIDQISNNDCRLGSFIISGDSIESIHQKYLSLLKEIKLEYVL